MEQSAPNKNAARIPKSQTSPPEINGEAMSAIDGPTVKTNAKGARTFKAQPGHHLAPQMLSSNRSVFEELGAGFSLIALDAAEATITAFADAAEAMNVPLKIIRDTFADKRTAYEAKLILVRPDHFVAWCANEAPTNADALLRRAVGSD